MGIVNGLGRYPPPTMESRVEKKIEHDTETLNPYVVVYKRRLVGAQVRRQV